MVSLHESQRLAQLARSLWSCDALCMTFKMLGEGMRIDLLSRPPSNRGKRPVASALISLCIVLFAGDTAVSQQPTTTQRNAVKSDCRSDFIAQCSGVQPGGIEALTCLQQHSATLSDSCRKAVSAITTAKPKTTAVPPVAVQPGAPAPAAGSGSPAQPPVVAPAATAMPAANPRGQMPSFTPREELFLVRETCGPDFRRFCQSTPLGGGRAIACLRENAARLSPGCQQVLAKGL
jgi:hypothetical protein